VVERLMNAMQAALPIPATPTKDPVRSLREEGAKVSA
jgi:hypothetical protein